MQNSKTLRLKNLVSVIIPTYNRLNYLPIAIDSVLQQSYPNFELIIIDDGSTDGTQEYIEGNYSSKVKYLWQENHGESFARNRGISIARGEYIAFLDSDDYWESNKLELQVNYLMKRDSNSLAGVFSPVWLVNQQGERIGNSPAGCIKSANDLNIENFFLKQVINAAPSNLLLKTSLLTEVGGFDESIQYGEDKDLVIRLRTKWELGYISTPLVFLRKHSLNQSTTINEEKIQSIFTDRENVILKNLTPDIRVKENTISTALLNIYTSAAGWCFYYEQWERGMEYVRKAEKLKNRAFKKIFPQKIAFIAAKKHPQNGPIDIELIDEYIQRTYIRNIVARWPDDLSEKFPARKFKGYFFNEILSNDFSGSKISIAYMLIKMTTFIPEIIVSMYSKVDKNRIYL